MKSELWCRCINAIARALELQIARWPDVDSRRLLKNGHCSGNHHNHKLTFARSAFRSNHQLLCRPVFLHRSSSAMSDSPTLFTSPWLRSSMFCFARWILEISQIDYVMKQFTRVRDCSAFFSVDITAFLTFCYECSVCLRFSLGWQRVCITLVGRSVMANASKFKGRKLFIQPHRVPRDAHDQFLSLATLVVTQQWSFSSTQFFCTLFCRWMSLQAVVSSSRSSVKQQSARGMLLRIPCFCSRFHVFTQWSTSLLLLVRLSAQTFAAWQIKGFLRAWWSEKELFRNYKESLHLKCAAAIEMSLWHKTEL